MNTEALYKVKAGEQFEKMRLDVNPRYTPTDLGCSRLFADFYRDTVRYVPEKRAWYVFNSRYWEEDAARVKVENCVKFLIEQLKLHADAVADDETREAQFKLVARLQNYGPRRTLLQDAQSEMVTHLDKFDTDDWLFNCTNGTLDLRGFDLRKFDPKDMITNMSNVEYIPGAESEKWKKFISDVCLKPGPNDPDYERRLTEFNDRACYLQKALGYALTGDTNEECMFMLYGSTTRNGKGTCMETFQYMLKSYAAAARPETFSGSLNSSGPSDDLARLAGKRFVNVSEPDRKLKLNAALVKSLTGNDTITARFLYGPAFEFKPRFKLFINTNCRPRVDDPTLFNSDRVRVLPFDRHFGEGERDPFLKQALREPREISGIFNWCLEGLGAVCFDGMKPSGAVARATEEYARESDSLGQFMDECMEQDPDAELRTQEARVAFNAWCQCNGYETENAVGFRQLMSHHAQIVRKKPRGGGYMSTFILGWKLKS